MSLRPAAMPLEARSESLLMDPRRHARDVCCIPRGLRAHSTNLAALKYSTALFEIKQQRNMKNSECIIEQYRRGKRVRTFTPTTDQNYPWSMHVNGKRYRRTHGWVLSKILPTLVEGSAVVTRVVGRNFSIRRAQTRTSK